jgi:hypothetical protein
MTSLRTLVADSVRTGAIAGGATTATVVALGQVEDGEAVAPVNAISHIVWGDEAAEQTAPSVKYTAVGLALNAAAIVGWAAVYHLVRSLRRKPRPLDAVTDAAGVTAAAYATDYYVVPKRFTPGFEKRLSGRSLAITYGVLAAGLALGGLAARKR